MSDPKPPPGKRRQSNVIKPIEPAPRTTIQPLCSSRQHGPHRPPPEQPSAPDAATDDPFAYRTDIAIAHALVLLTGLGFVIAVIIWVLRRDQSRHAAFQMAQAVVWQLLYIIVGGLIGCFSSGIMLAGITGSLLSGSRDGSTLAIYCYRAITLLTAGAFVLPGLAAAWASWNGRRFRYPLIAGWVERRMTPR